MILTAEISSERPEQKSVAENQSVNLLTFLFVSCEQFCPLLYLSLASTGLTSDYQ